MKTRQEMVYDFMVALAGNSYHYKEWTENVDIFGDYTPHLMAYAEEFADRYLGSLG